MSTGNDQDNRRRVGLLPAVGGLILLVVAGLMVPIPFMGRAAVAIGDLVHAPLFGSMAFGAFVLLQRIRPLPAASRSLLVRCVVISLALFAFGAAMELVQHSIGRTATYHDAISNGLGILVAMCWYWSRQIRQADRVSFSRALFTIGIGGLAVAWWSPLAMLHDVWAVHRDFPLIGSFESKTELQRWYFRDCQATLSSEAVTDGNHAMEVQYEATSHPGATMIEMHKDWSNIEALELDVTLDASYSRPYVTFMMKVIDELQQPDDHDDAFRRQWQLEPGKRQRITVTRDELIRGPENREIDLHQIRFVDCLLIAPVEPTSVRFDRFLLNLRQ